jgi:hypothetical protein
MSGYREVNNTASPKSSPTACALALAVAQGEDFNFARFLEPSPLERAG